MTSRISLRGTGLFNLKMVFMGKRRNKSRLTKTDVNTICEMQRKITAYENYIVAMCSMILNRDIRKEPALLLDDTPMDDWMNESWRGLREMKKELLELKKTKFADDAMEASRRLYQDGSLEFTGK